MDLRHQGLYLLHIARLPRAPFSTVARALGRRGVARFGKVGHRITGDRQKGRSYGVGYDKIHVTVDDATRLAYVEVLEDEQKQPVIGFLSRAVAWFNGQGIEHHRLMRDKGCS